MRAVSLSLLLLALGGVARAATPMHRLVAVGEVLNWPTGDQSVTLNVREPGVVTLTVDPPGFDGTGYTARRAVTHDEQYRPGVVTTTYQLTDAARRVLLRRDYSPRQGMPQTIFSGALQPGSQLDFVHRQVIREPGGLPEL